MHPSALTLRVIAEQHWRIDDDIEPSYLRDQDIALIDKSLLVVCGKPSMRRCCDLAEMPALWNANESAGMHACPTPLQQAAPGPEVSIPLRMLCPDPLARQLQDNPHSHDACMLAVIHGHVCTVAGHSCGKQCRESLKAAPPDAAAAVCDAAAAAAAATEVSEAEIAACAAACNQSLTLHQ